MANQSSKSNRNKKSTSSKSTEVNKKQNRTSRAENLSQQKKTVRHNSAREKESTKPVTPVHSTIEEPVRIEIIMTITALASILLILSYFNLCGTVGRFINQLMFGLLGVFTYAFPFVLFFFVAFFLSNRSNRIAKQKLLSGLAILFLLTGLIQLAYGIDENRKLLDYYIVCSENKCGGGIFGAVIAVPLTKLFGTVGSAVIIAAFMIVFMLLLTGKALFRLMRNMSAEKWQQKKELQRIRDEEYERMKQEESLKRQENARRIQMVDVVPQGIHNADSKGRVQVELPESEPKHSFLDVLREKSGVKNLPYETETVNKNDSVYRQIEMEEVEVQKTAKKNKTVQGESYLTELERKFAGKGHTVGELRAKEFDEFRFEQKLPEETSSFVPEHEIPAEPVSVTTDDQVTMKKPSKSDTSKEKLTPQEEAEQLSAMSTAMEEQVKKYVFPPLSLLSRPKSGSGGGNAQNEIERNADLLQRTLNSFGVHVKLLNVSCGPAVTRYELQPEQGVKVSSITKLENDIKLNLAASDIRIEAPIPGKAAIGIEVPNKENSAVLIRDLFECKEYTDKDYGVVFAVGKDITGHNIVSDIAKMPHLLIAGATGSGKSVCINTLIMSILYKYNPNDVRLIMIDPKVVELSVYNGIPHLLIPVVTDPKKAAASLNWAVMEMTNRYNKFAELHVRDLKGYNQKMEEEPYRSDPAYQKLPKIVIVVDELADLMMVAPGEVEDAIIRLSQLARAAGMHLIIATQRPSVNVITGLIKANMPSRIAFAVTSQVDSRTILDGAGAEKLLGKGDMLFFPSGYPKPIRVQGAYVSDDEVEKVVSFIKEKNTEAQYNEEVTSHINSVQTSSATTVSGPDSAGAGNGRDEYFVEAGRFIIEKDKASIGMLQRVYRIGFNRAARLMEQLADAGVVSEEDGTKPRRILMSKEQFEQYVEENV